MMKKQRKQIFVKKCSKGYRYYAAKILMQYRVVVDGESNKMRPCAIKTILLTAKTHKEAIRLAKKIGRSDEVSYENSDGNIVYVEFVGIVELIDIDFNLQRFNEVWLSFGDMLNPMERKNDLTASDKYLLERLEM